MLVSLLSQTGLRISEALNIKLSNIEKETRKNCWIRVLGKGDKERMIIAPSPTIKGIKNHFKRKIYLFEHNGHSYNSRSITQRITIEGYKILGREYHISAHTFRHSFATEKIKQGVSPQKLSLMLGHSKVSTTLDLYVHETPSEDDWNI